MLRKIPGEAARVSGQSGLMRRGRAFAGTSLPREKLCEYATLALRAFCNSQFEQFFGLCASIASTLRGH